MNKTVTINLSGIIFHIDEDAYQKLNSYLNTIRSYFSESEGRDEIMADIENRIAEMLSTRVSDRKQAVLIADVDYVIGVMGKPEDFAGEKTQNGNTSAGEPAARTYHGRRRVFRDPDNKILGGVCSGIANYFNFDPLWLRLALAILAILGFGMGVVLYIVLWIIIPEAKTTAEKLEMRGEEVNFSNIGKKVEEEMQQFGKKVENWGEEVKKSTTARNVGNFVQKFFDFIGTVFGAFFKAFTKLLGIFLVIVGLIILVSIMASLLGGTTLIHAKDFSYSANDFLDTFFVTDHQKLLAAIAIILFIGVPMVMLVYGGFRLILGIRQTHRFVNMGAGILWLIGLALALLSGISAVNQFSEEASSREYFGLKKPKSDTLILRVREVKEWNDSREQRHRRHSHFFFHKRNLIAADSTTIYFGFPTLDIVRGNADSIEIVVFREARGADRKEALHNARNISYDIFQNDSILEFMPYYTIPNDEKWRWQHAHVEIRLPKGKTVYLSKSMRHIIHDLHNESDTYDGDMVGRRWVMGEEELKCLDCAGLDHEKKEGWRKHGERKSAEDEHILPPPPAPTPLKEEK